MITLTTEQAQQIEEAFDKARIGLRDWELPENRYAALNAINPALAAMRAARAQEQAEPEPVIDLSKVRHEDKCRYWDDETFCDCGADSHALLEWHRNNKAAPVQQAEQEPFDMEDHPPHRLCECRKCMEYFTPLPDCDAFAAFGKPIAEQTNTQLMEGYRIGLAEMREKCAKLCEDLYKNLNHDADCRKLWPHTKMINDQYAAAIRAIKFEGDTGFRQVSEMIAEHKQDPKKAAAIEKAKMRKAVQEPVAWRIVSEDGVKLSDWIDGAPSEGQERWETAHGNAVQRAYAAPQPVKQKPVAFKFVRYVDGKEMAEGVTIEREKTLDAAIKKAVALCPNRDKTVLVYATPVRTKDLTKEEIQNAMMPIEPTGKDYFLRLARAVIAKFKEKNK